MLPLTYERRWRIASALLLVAVLTAALLPAVWFWDDRVRLIGWLDGLDKWTHALTFVALTIWFAGQYRPTAYWRIAIGLAGFGALIEVCQRAVGYRTAELMDLWADVGGIAVGLLIAMAGLGGWCQRVEAWLAARQQ